MSHMIEHFANIQRIIANTATVIGLFLKPACSQKDLPFGEVSRPEFHHFFGSPMISSPNDRSVINLIVSLLNIKGTSIHPENHSRLLKAFQLSKAKKDQRCLAW